ncbi:MAG: methyltransferase domain-containing protein, partial [Myxococcales bacterium]|nr:methyltransferase domain-containing protein [Myxococcales bacterium]
HFARAQEMNVDDLALALGVGSARGARALARAVGATGVGPPSDAKLTVVTLGDAVARAIEEAGHVALRARFEGGRLPLEDGTADALCTSGLPDLSVAQELIKQCARVVRNGGSVIIATAVGIVGRGPERHVLTAMFMHAGLVGISQQLSRGTALTGGRVRR